MFVAPYGTSSIVSSTSVLRNGLAGSAATPRAPPLFFQPGTRRAFAIIFTAGAASVPNGGEGTGLAPSTNVKLEGRSA